MTFYKDPEDDELGFCDCKANEGPDYRPLVYSAEQDRCYWIFDQVE